MGRKVLPPPRKQAGPWGKSLPPSRQKGQLTLGQGQSQASSTTEQWVLLGGSFLALGIGLAVAGFYHRKG